MTSGRFHVQSSQCPEDEVIDFEDPYDVLPLYKRWCICSVFLYKNAVCILLLLLWAKM